MKQNNLGYTFIEVIVSVGIIAVAVITIYQIIFNYYQTIELFNEKTDLNYLSNHYFEKQSLESPLTTKSIIETIEFNKKTYEININIKDFDIEELLLKNMISKEIIEQYKIYTDRTEDLKEVELRITTEDGNTFNWTKIMNIY